MAASSAVTINRSEQEITSRLSEADPLLTGEDARISYGPAPETEGLKSGWCWKPACLAARSARRSRRWSAPTPNVSSMMRSAASSR